MPTILHRLPNVNPDSTGLTPIDITSDEVSLYNETSLLYWIDGANFEPSLGARCRKTDRLLVPAQSKLPAPTSLAAYNNKTALVFGSGTANGNLYDAGQAWLPINSDFTIAFVGRHGPSDNAYLFGNGQTITPESSGTYLQQGSTGAYTFQINGVTAMPATTATFLRPYEVGPSLIIASFSDSTKIPRFRGQRGAFVYTGSALAVSNVNGEFHLGAAGGTPTGHIDGGDIGSFMIFNKDLLISANASLLALVETVLGTKYNIPAP